MSSGPSPIEPESWLDGLRWSAILRGAVLDIVLTILAGIALVFHLAGGEAFSEDAQAAERALEEALAAPEYLLWSFVIGISITAYAGYWAARRAGVLHVRHGGWTAVVSAVLGSLFLLVPGEGTGPSAPWWYDALALGLMLPAGLFGGWVAAKRAERG